MKNFGSLSLRRIMLGAVFIGGVFIAALSYDSGPVKSRPLELLTQSYNLSKTLNNYDRTFALLMILKNGKGIIPDPDYKSWSIEMREQAQGIIDGWDRVAQEKNAVVQLSEVDPLQAMREFEKIEDPLSQSDNTFPEDVRADGLADIFLNAWKSQLPNASKMQILKDSEAEAVRLPKAKHGGEYAYVAMASVINVLMDEGTVESKTEANEIFRQALNYYREERNQFITRDDQFEIFLQGTKDLAIDRQMLSDAAGVFVDKVLSSPQYRGYSAEVQTSTKETIYFSDDRVKRLFFAFPMIEELAPGRADGLRKINLDFGKKASLKDLITGGYVALDKDARQAQAVHSKIRQGSLVNEIIKIRDSEPAKAMSLAAGLEDSAIQIQGYSALLPALVKSNPAQAQQIYDRERSRLQDFQDETDHLTALVALAEASSYVHDNRLFLELTKTALGAGTTLFDTDSRLTPGLAPTSRRGYRNLTELVTFGTKQRLESLQDQVNQLESPSLKACLLTYMARAINESQVKN